MNEEVERPKCDLKDVTVVVMSYVAQVAAYILCGTIIFHPPDMTDSTVATLVGTVVGFLISEAKNFSSYWTGTTRSSSDKDRTIASQQAAIAGTGNGLATTTTTTPEGVTTIETKPIAPIVPSEPINVINAEGTALKTDPVKE